MTDFPRLPSPAELLHHLEHSAELQHQTVAPAGLVEQVAMLRRWQADRLARTYADLLTDTRYSAACQFFLNDIYAPVDFSQCDHDLERIYRFVSRVLPSQTIQLLTETVELNNMTQALDGRLLRVLVEELGVEDTLTSELYAQAYRICDNYLERAQQIELTRSILMEVGAGARLLLVGAAMKLVKGPAERAGWSELYSFLERGYQAFRELKDVKAFADTIAQREMGLLDLIYAGDLPGFEKLVGLT
jgi:hypothetical protein